MRQIKARLNRITAYEWAGLIVVIPVCVLVALVAVLMFHWFGLWGAYVCAALLFGFWLRGKVA